MCVCHMQHAILQIIVVSVKAVKVVELVDWVDWMGGAMQCVAGGGCLLLYIQRHLLYQQLQLTQVTAAPVPHQLLYPFQRHLSSCSHCRTMSTAMERVRNGLLNGGKYVGCV